MRRRLAHPDHPVHRTGLRASGAVLTVAGAVLTAIGLISFFSAFGGGSPPSLFWCAFLGLPLLGFGSLLLKAGYAGAIARYVATEAAPVAADAIDHVAHHTRDAVHGTAAAIAAGLRGSPPLRHCSGCGAEAAPRAQFCDQCGASLPGRIVCVRCRHDNDPSARFCAGCGHELAVL